MRDTPGSDASRQTLRSVLERWQGHAALDEAWAANIASAREAALAELDGDPWRGDQRPFSGDVV